VPALGTTFVTGKVTDSGNNPVIGTPVNVTCVNEKGNDVTDSSGTYMILLNDPSCAPGSTAYATATAYGVSNHGLVCNGPGSNIKCDGIDLALVNIQVPEFGVIAGAVALVGALGIFIYRRKA